jgi:hypothetical protein
MPAPMTPLPALPETVLVELGRKAGFTFTRPMMAPPKVTPRLAGLPEGHDQLMTFAGLVQTELTQNLEWLKAFAAQVQAQREPNMRFINRLAPSHAYNSCSDLSYNNSGDGYFDGCPRCNLLRAALSSPEPEPDDDD